MMNETKTNAGANGAPVSINFAMQCAEHQTNAVHMPDAPSVRASYQAFKAETLAQFEHLTKVLGVRVELWTDAGQPYKDSQALRDDVRDNNRIYVFSGGDLSENHPLATVAISKPRRAPDVCHARWTAQNWKLYFSELTFNEVFRAVHDFAHVQSGYGFGARGEWNTAIYHSKAYSVAALPALLCETVFQNCFVNYGAHMRTGGELSGAHLLPLGSEFRLKPSARPYAEQKCFVVPEYFLDVWSDVCANGYAHDAETMRRWYIERRAGAHSCRGLNWCAACGFEFSERGKAEILTYFGGKDFTR